MSNSVKALQVKPEAFRQNDPNVQQRSLDKQRVLDEDAYTAALSKIIARDFFPSLQHRDGEHLSDLQKFTSAQSLSQETPQDLYNAETPFGGRLTDTPLRVPTSTRKRQHDELSLDEFQAKYTSEDNSSFTGILRDENLQRRQRWGWAWDAENKANETR